MLSYGSGDTRENAPLAIRALGRTALKREFADLSEAADVVKSDSIGWRLAYFGALTDDALTGRWQASCELRRPGRFRIARWDVADALLALTADPSYERTAVVLGGAR